MVFAVAPAAQAAQPRLPGPAPKVTVAPSIMAKLTGRYTHARARALAARHGMRVLREFPEIGWVELRTRRTAGPIARAAATRDARAALRGDAAVARTDGLQGGERIGPAAQPADAIWTITDSIVNPGTQSEIAQPAWHYRIANFPAAWDLSTGGSATSVAVIDSEFWTEHPDLKDKLLPGLNLSPLDTPSGTYRTPDVRGTNADPQFHGTHVAGLVGAATNNVIGVSGAGYNTPIIPVKINFQSPSIVADVTEAINYATSRGPVAINMSFGGQAFHPAWQDALSRARASGVLPVASAANDQLQRPGFTFYPAAMSGVLAVGATTPSDQIAFFSSTGAFVDVSAPGDPILSTWDERIQSNFAQGYHVDGGTSMAAPIVSGLVALIKSRRPDLTPDEVEAIITGTAVDKGLQGKDQNYGWGRIDAGRALAAAAAFQRAAPPAPAPVAAPTFVASKVRFSSRSLVVRRGKLFTLYGRVQPAVAGLRVRVQLRRKGKKAFRTIATVRSKSGGRVVARLRIRKGGKYALRLGVVSTGTIVGSKSGVISVRVR
jgi:subtilisin family serine protease